MIKILTKQKLEEMLNASHTDGFAAGYRKAHKELERDKAAYHQSFRELRERKAQIILEGMREYLGRGKS